MIKTAFLKAQTEKSRRESKTSPFLRRLIFSTIEQTAKTRYAADYPVRCLQTSVAAQALLARFGIKSELWLGALCAAGLYTDPPAATWVGFWDQDHHVWLRTEFNELVNLSASQLHQHPRSQRKDGIGMPAVWWDDISEWPSVIRYLPDTWLRAVRLPDAGDQADLEAFEGAVSILTDEHLQNASVEQIAFGPILDNVETMNRLTQAGHPWVRGALAYQNLDVDFPPWVLEREQELVEAHKAGKRATSRLAPRLLAVHATTDAAS